MNSPSVSHQGICAGTTITLHLKDDAEEFSDSWRVRSVIKKYSDHISVPVMMPEPPAPAGDNEDAAEGACRTRMAGG